MPAWYREGAVPDTIDGRFDMIAAILALVLIRIEREEDREAPTLLAELFIDDMEGSVRQIGIGDLMVGKHVGKMMGALGGRLTSFRAAFAADGDLEQAVARNIFHEAPPSPEALAFVASHLRQFHDALEAAPAEALIAGRLPE
jgi:cytochrome b pre-mRNA-processing protein 3